MKKVLFIIVLILLISFGNTYATEFSDINKDPQLQEAVGVLSSYGIINGYPDNSFKPDKVITRAEMAKVVVVAAGYYDYSKNMVSLYEDMKGHWAENYVELANVLGIVKGISPTLFGPDNLIRFEEAYTMIIRLLGYTDESLIGNWPSNYHEKAVELNLFENIDSSVEFASRRDISIMLYNALEMNLVNVRDNNRINVTNKPLLSKLGKKETKEVTIKDLSVDNFDYTDYLFNKWDIYYDNKGKAVHLTNPRYNEFTGTVTSLLTNRVIFVTDDYGNVRVFQVPEVPIVINGEKGNFSNLIDARIKVVYEEDSFKGDVLGIIAYKVTDVIVVEKKDLYKEGSKQFAGKNLPMINSEINYEKLHIRGDAKTLEDISLHDVVYFYETKESGRNSALTLKVLRSKTEGIVTDVQKIDGKTFYTVNNISYMTGKDYIFTEEANINDHVTLVLDNNNNIIKLYINKYGKKPSTYGIVVSSNSSTSGNATARILDQYGRLRTYSLSDNSNVVRVIENESHDFKQVLIKSRDIIKFDPVLTGTVKIIDSMYSTPIAGSYDSSSRTLANKYYISPDTFIVYENNGKFQLLEISQLNSYLEGRAVINSSGHIDAIYLTKGLKTTLVETLPDTSVSYTGTIYGIIKGTTKIDDSISHVQFFNDSNVFSISNSSTAGKRITSLMNTYVRAVIVNGVITNLERVTPETERIKITQVYTNQLLIDDITYIEYTSDIKVYLCTLDSSGNIIAFKEGSKTDVKAGVTAQLYDLYGGFDGIIDVVIIYK
ncbi:MAG TPA: S-layer homology domain-containing protein [Tissierellia bacterium]|nr:S-layer homology domain-containing protein [Tissierellia bacterium]